MQDQKREKIHPESRQGRALVEPASLLLPWTKKIINHSYQWPPTLPHGLTRGARQSPERRRRSGEWRGGVVTIFSEVLVPGVSEPVSSWALHS